MTNLVNTSAETQIMAKVKVLHFTGIMLTAKQKEQQNNNNSNNYAHEQDRWRALANVIMDVRVPYNAGNFMTS
jgi:hypothetical protein